MPARKKRAEAVQDGVAASPQPETPQAPLSLNQQRRAGVVKRDRRKRFNQE